MNEPIELWYIDVTFNNRNSECYADMMNEMRSIKNGVFSCTIKITDSNICDLIITENDTFHDDYVKPSPAKTNKIPRPKY